MNLALSQSQQQQQQATTTNNILTLGSGVTPKYEHLISPLHHSSFQQQQSPQSMSSSPFFINDPNQQFQDHQGPFSNNKQLHGLMQLPDFQGTATTNNNNNTTTSPFNLSFFPNNNSDQFNNISEGGYTNSFSSHFGNSTFQQENMSMSMSMSPHMSATALLQKASQMGSSSTTTNTTNGVENNHTHRSERECMENDNHHLHGLMNSLANGNTSIFDHHNMKGNHENSLAQFHNMEETKKLSSQSQTQNLGLCFGGSDKLTLDFLGVGGMVRNMSNSSGGFSQRDQQLHSMNNTMNSMDPKVDSTHANQPF